MLLKRPNMSFCTYSKIKRNKFISWIFVLATWPPNNNHVLIRKWGHIQCSNLQSSVHGSASFQQSTRWTKSPIKFGEQNLILMTQTLPGTVNVFSTSESWKFVLVQAGTFLFCNLVRKLSMKVVKTGKDFTIRVVIKTFLYLFVMFSLAQNKITNLTLQQSKNPRQERNCYNKRIMNSLTTSDD